MAFKKVVLYKTIPTMPPREVYFDDFDEHRNVGHTLAPRLAMGFVDQRAAYEFAGNFENLLDWKVGLR